MATNMNEVCDALRRTLGIDKVPETKQYNKRIEETEHHLTDMARCVEKYATITEKLAQKGEKLSSSMGICASDLESNPTVKNNLANYTRHLSTVQKQRKVLKDLLQKKISRDILAYEGKCREMRKSMKTCEDTVRKRNHRFFLLEKAKNSGPLNPRKIDEANIKFEQARCEAERSCEDVKVEMKHFEAQKREDLNRILGDFLLAEMRFHAQALQAYTASFRCLPLRFEGYDKDRPRGHTRKSSRGKEVRKVSFPGSEVKTKRPASESAPKQRSDSSDSKLSLGDLE